MAEVRSVRGNNPQWGTRVTAARLGLGTRGVARRPWQWWSARRRRAAGGLSDRWRGCIASWEMDLGRVMSRPTGHSARIAVGRHLLERELLPSSRLCPVGRDTHPASPAEYGWPHSWAEGYPAGIEMCGEALGAFGRTGLSPEPPYEGLSPPFADAVGGCRAVRGGGVRWVKWAVPLRRVGSTLFVGVRPLADGWAKPQSRGCAHCRVMGAPGGRRCAGWWRRVYAGPGRAAPASPCSGWVWGPMRAEGLEPLCSPSAAPTSPGTGYCVAGHGLLRRRSMSTS